jgi:glycerol-3-phosphate acyltransferase PlsX
VQSLHSFPIQFALDAMGGDHGPGVVIPGAAIALKCRPDSRFLFIGDEKLINPLLEKYPQLKPVSTVRHTNISIRMDEKPAQALRQGRRVSSMWQALDAVKLKTAHVAVSAGNTGALMAMAKVNLRMMPGIERPALAAIWPTLKGKSIVLDMGATIGADARQLVDFAVMGAAMAHIIKNIEHPSVGLLNIGVEEMKGVENIREAGRLLREADFPNLDYKGFVEGGDIGRGTVDVVVTEGFAGNIALKTAEGTASQIASYLRTAMKRTWRAKLGYLLAKPAFDALRSKMDPRAANGGVFLGLNGIVIKSHGGTDALGFAAAIELGYDMARYDLLNQISASIAHYNTTTGIAAMKETTS